MKASKNFYIVLVFFILAGLFILSAGCLKTAQGAFQKPDDTGFSVGTPADPLPVPAEGLAVVTTVQPAPLNSSANAASPIFPEEYYRDIRNLTGKSGVNTSLPVQNSWSSRQPVYTLHYSENYGVAAFEVNVTHGPLVVIFKAKPKKNDARISFADLTIREMPSKGIVAHERIDHYITTKSSSDAEEQTDSSGNVIAQGPPEFGKLNEKEIIVYKEGLFHINVYGNQVDADVNAFTGDSPVSASGRTIASYGTPAPEEEYW